MATLNTLRNKGGALLAIVIGIALIAFVLGDLLTSGSTLMNSSKMTAGIINGDKIPIQEYEQSVNELTAIQQISSGDASSTDEQNEAIRTQAWDQMIREKAFKPSAAAAGLRISEEEMVSLLSGDHVSPIILQMFGNPQTGQFSPEALRNFVAQVNEDETGQTQLFWNYIQQEVADQTLVQKFGNLVQKAAYVTSFEAKQMAQLSSKSYTVRYIVERYETIADSTVQVTNAELNKFYSAHKEMFRQEDSRSIEYVTFEALPIATDYTAAQEKMSKLAADFAAAPNVQQFVSFNSQTPFDARYYNPAELNSALAEFVASATPEQLYGPVLQGDQWTLARVADVQTMPDSVRLSTIMMPSGQKVVADSLVTALRGGGDFAMAAANHSADRQSAEQGGDIGMVDAQQLPPSVIAAIKGAKVGAIATAEMTVENGEVYIVIVKVAAIQGESRKIQLGIVTYNVEASELTRNEIYNKANQFATTSKSGEFDKAVTEGALAKRTANIGPNDRTVGGIQQSRELARWAFTDKVGSVSDVLEFGNTFVIAKITTIRDKGLAPFEQVKEAVRAQVLLQKKGDLLAAKLAGLTTLDGREGVIEAGDINFQGFMAPEVGFEPAFVGGVAAAKAGQFTKPILGRIGVYAVQVVEATENPVDQALEKARLGAEVQQSAFVSAYEALVGLSDVRDTRYRFY